MSDFQLGIVWGACISTALLVFLWALVGEILEHQERRREQRWKRAYEKAAEVKPPRHSRKQSQEGTTRLYPPEVVNTSTNLLFDQDQDRARPLHWPPPRGQGLPWKAHDDQAREDTLW